VPRSLRDRQGLDGFNVVADCLRGVPQVDRALGVEPELGEFRKRCSRGDGVVPCIPALVPSAEFRGSSGGAIPNPASIQYCVPGILSRVKRPRYEGQIFTLRMRAVQAVGSSLSRQALASEGPTAWLPGGRVLALIVHGKRSISPDTALRLARCFGMTEAFWSNLQVHYDLEVERDRLGSRLEKEVVVYARSE